jgi:prepilin-type N-terminal cleavage/methylation domain-containing protein
MSNKKQDFFLRRRNRASEKGFTLIELLVVIAVLAILAAIVLFNVVGVTTRGNKSACDTDKATIQTAVDAWINDNSNGVGTAPNILVLGDMTKTQAPATDSALNLLVSKGYIHTATTSCKTMTLGAFSSTTGMPVSVTYNGS